MNAKQLFEEIQKNRSFLCVGLDTDLKKIPDHLTKAEYPQFEFNRTVIEATAPYTVCFKLNLAFYEENGAKGWESFLKTCSHIREKYPDILIIADAKRGDIGNTSQMYARAFFDDGLVDAVTISPYMGYDTAEPYFNYRGRWAVILALTSNPSAADFQMQRLENGKYLYEQVLETSRSWGTTDNTMYVIGATRTRMLRSIRKIVPHHFLLVPGVGAQGGSLQGVAEFGMNRQVGLLVNSSRGIIFADRTERFAAVAGEKAAEMQQQMDTLLTKYLK